MYKYILRRLLLMIPILFGLLFIIFTILSVMPGEPGRLVLGVEATAEQIHMFNVEFGLDKLKIQRANAVSSFKNVINILWDV